MKKLIFGIVLLLAVLPCFGQKYNVVQGAVSYEQLLERKNPDSKLLLLSADLNSNNYDCILYVVTDPNLISKAQDAVAKFKGKASFNDLRSKFLKGVNAVAICTEPNWRPGKGIAAFNLSEIDNIFYVYAACPKGFQGTQIASHKNTIYSGTLDTRQFTEDTLITFVDKSGTLDMQVSNTLKPAWNIAGIYGVVNKNVQKGFITIPDSYFPKKDWSKYVKEQSANENSQQQEQSVVKYKRAITEPVINSVYTEYDDGRTQGSIPQQFYDYTGRVDAYHISRAQEIFSKSNIGDVYYLYEEKNYRGKPLYQGGSVDFHNGTYSSSTIVSAGYLEHTYLVWRVTIVEE